MNWDIAVAICEIISALAVVFTLFYLSQQIKESNVYAKASTVRENNALYMEVFSPLMQDHELASIYARALDGEVLDRVEAVRFEAFINNFMAWAEAAYFQIKAQYVFAEYLQDTDEMLKVFAPYFGQLLKTDVGESWWGNAAPNLFSVEFIQNVNATVFSDADEQ